eukprot:6358129-Alexandrium_andersonii.AAC.1
MAAESHRSCPSELHSASAELDRASQEEHFPSWPPASSAGAAAARGEGGRASWWRSLGRRSAT